VPAVAGNPAILAGQFPVLTPGRRNLFQLLRQTSPAAREDGILGDQRLTVGNQNRDIIGRTTDVTVSYRPRWLWLAG
jgi:hypothetical protein